ncbi:hypothetical protein ASC80_05695 [Afipia sp. Root123D2]|nr:hypothetical protein ASC80_05695 [Afipia sp. Root123D2]
MVSICPFALEIDRAGDDHEGEVTHAVMPFVRFDPFDKAAAAFGRDIHHKPLLDLMSVPIEPGGDVETLVQFNEGFSYIAVAVGDDHRSKTRNAVDQERLI